jgi:hypothetical protein
MDTPAIRFLTRGQQLGRLEQRVLSHVRAEIEADKTAWDSVGIKSAEDVEDLWNAYRCRCACRRAASRSTHRASRGMGWMGEDRSPVALLWTVGRVRVAADSIQDGMARSRPGNRCFSGPENSGDEYNRYFLSQIR